MGGKEPHWMKFPVDPAVQQGTEQEQCDLADGFHPIYGPQNTVYQQHSSTTERDHAHKGEDAFLPVVQKKHLPISGGMVTEF